MRKIAFLLTALSGLLTLAPAHATHVTRTESYIAGFLGDAELNLCEDATPLAMNIDQVCFSVNAGTRYRVSINDTVNGSSIGYLWVFRDSAGDCIGASDDPLTGCPNSGLTCGTQTFQAPSGAVQLTILLDGPVYGPLDCLVGGPGDSVGMATQGSVSVTTLHG